MDTNTTDTMIILPSEMLQTFKTLLKPVRKGLL